VDQFDFVRHSEGTNRPSHVLSEAEGNLASAYALVSLAGYFTPSGRSEGIIVI